MSLPDVVHRFKSLTTARFRHGVGEYGWPPFFRKLWQRNYYDHVTRDRNEWDRIQTYIATNPARWAEDVNNPARGRGASGQATANNKARSRFKKAGERPPPI